MPSATMTLNITSPVNVMLDADTYWKRQIGNTSAGSLVNPVTATDTALAISMPNNQSILPGMALYIDQEEMTVQSVVLPDATTTYSQVTVSRGPSQTTPNGPTQFPRANPLAHAAGTIVQVLQYASPWIMFAERYVRPGMNAIVAELGSASLTLAAATTGSATLNP